MIKTSLKNLSTDLQFVYSLNNSISITFQDNDTLMGVVGELNSNLRELEKLTGLTIYFRGNSIIIKGNKEKNEVVKISSFGTFSLRDKTARVGRNPKTGEEAPIEPRRVLTFRPSHIMRDRVVKGNKG